MHRFCGSLEESELKTNSPVPPIYIQIIFIEQSKVFSNIVLLNMQISTAVLLKLLRQCMHVIFCLSAVDFFIFFAPDKIKCEQGSKNLIQSNGPLEMHLNVRCELQAVSAGSRHNVEMRYSA